MFAFCGDPVSVSQKKLKIVSTRDEIRMKVVAWWITRRTHSGISHQPKGSC